MKTNVGSKPAPSKKEINSGMKRKKYFEHKKIPGAGTSAGTVATSMLPTGASIIFLE